MQRLLIKMAAKRVGPSGSRFTTFTHLRFPSFGEQSLEITGAAGLRCCLFYPIRSLVSVLVECNNEDQFSPEKSESSERPSVALRLLLFSLVHNPLLP